MAQPKKKKKYKKVKNKLEVITEKNTGEKELKVKTDSFPSFFFFLCKICLEFFSLEDQCSGLYESDGWSRRYEGHKRNWSSQRVLASSSYSHHARMLRLSFLSCREIDGLPAGVSSPIDSELSEAARAPMDFQISRVPWEIWPLATDTFDMNDWLTRVQPGGP